MFKIKVDGNKLVTAINAMTAYTPEGWVMFDSPGTMFLKSFDIAMIGLAEARLKCVVEGEPRDFKIKYTDLPTDASGEVEIEVSDRAYTSVGRINYKAALIAILSHEKQPPNPKVDWKIIFDLPMSEFKMGLKAVLGKIDPKDSSQSIHYKWTGKEFIIEDGKGELVDVTYEESELAFRLKPDVPLSTHIPADHMRELHKKLPNFDRALLAFGQDLPLSIGCNGEGIGCGWFTAPRIDK